MTAVLHAAPERDIGTTSPRSAFVEGVRDITPMVVGVVPFGMAIGATAGTLQVDAGAAVASAPIILPEPRNSPPSKCSTLVSPRS